MTDPTPLNPEQAAATRQAAAFLLHTGNRDNDGVNAILDELNADPDNTGRFVFALASIFGSIVPVIYSTSGQWLVQQLIADIAGLENGDVA